MALITRQGKGSKLTIQEMDGNLEYLQGLGLAGTNYVFVSANGTDVENATELNAAYTLAKTMSPSATNRITIVAAPGYYNFGDVDFIMDTEYIDLVSLDGNRSIIFNSSNSNGTISITANDVFVKGVDVQTKSFTIATNLNLLRVENCAGGDLSFGHYAAASGTFTNCIAGNSSFGHYSTASGTFTNCTAGTKSFGSDAIYAVASGIFTNCTSGDASFGGGSGKAQGTFNNCISGEDSFGGIGSGAQTSGTFNNCISGIYSFRGTLTGKLYYCRLTSGTFRTVSSGGITRLCIDGSNTENNQG
jgi:hypothetical protein